MKSKRSRSSLGTTAIFCSTLLWATALHAQGPVLPAVTMTPISPFTGDLRAGDFNGDGNLDLAGRLSSGRIGVALGNGNGTFATAVASSTSGDVLAVGDLNGDGRVDVVASVGNTLAALPGAGNGTLGAAVPILPATIGGRYRVATVADLDNDGNMDIVADTEEGIGPTDVIYVAPGNGDFTFDPTFEIPAGVITYGHTVADLNGDGLRDIVVTDATQTRVLVLLNGGAFQFSPTGYLTEHATTGVVARDFNGDGRLDLAVTARDRSFWPYGEGWVYVFPGNGDGTFGSYTQVPVRPGALSIVAGDFTRDGIIDIATSNESTHFVDHMCGSSFQGSDSVSILQGNGNGTFTVRADFALEQVIPNPQLQRTIGTLATGDLNKDGHLDLLVGPGRVLFNNAPRANRPPVVSAGEDFTTNSSEALITGTATDPDGHYLVFGWTEDAPATSVDEPRMRFGVVSTCAGAVPGQNIRYFNASDGHGPIVSDQLIVTRETIGDEPSLVLLNPHQDEVIQTGTAYSITWDAIPDSGFTEFDLFYTPTAGSNFQPIPECTNLPGTATSCAWTPAAGAASERAQIRLIGMAANGGMHFEESPRFRVRAPGGAGLEPGWQLDDVGDVGATGSASSSGGVFTVRGSGADIWDTRDEFFWVHKQTMGDFDFSARVLSVQNVDQWTKAGLMVRKTFGAGAGAQHASIFVTPTTVKGIAFQRRRLENGLSTSTAGPALTGPVWVRLLRQGDTVVSYYRTSTSSAWVEVGRDTLPGIGNFIEIGLAVSSHSDGRLATATFDNVSLTPLTTTLTITQPQAGDELRANAPNEIRWTLDDHVDITMIQVFASDSVTPSFTLVENCGNLPRTARSCTWTTPGPRNQARLWVRAIGSTGVVASDMTGIFSIVDEPGGGEGDGQAGDIGNVGAAGSVVQTGTTWTVSGAGADVWDTADAFFYASREVTGDFDVSTLVTGVQHVHDWTKAGIMMRETRTASSPHAFVIATPSATKGVAFQRRPTAGGQSVHTAGPAVAPPYYIRLVRTGNVVKSYYRAPADSEAFWVLIGTQTFAALPDTVHVGLAVSSHVRGTVASATFEDFGGNQPVWTSADIGDVGSPGAALMNANGQVTVSGAGADVWDTADAFHFLSRTVVGDFDFTARVASVQNVNAWTKAGLMVRESTAANARHAFAIATPTTAKGVAFQRRPTPGGLSVHTAGPAAAPPGWLLLRREGTMISAFYRQLPTDTWTLIGRQEFPSLGASLQVGFAVSSHVRGEVATAVFDNVEMLPLQTH